MATPTNTVIPNPPPVTSSGQPVSQSSGSIVPEVQYNSNPTGISAPVNANASVSSLDPIDASQLSGSSPFTLPSTPSLPNYDISNLPSLSSLLNPAPTAAQQKQDSLDSELENDEGKLGTEAAATITAQNAAGVPGFQSTLNDLNAQLNQLKTDAATATENSEDREAPMFAINGEQAQIQRQQSVKALGISSMIQATQGNLSLAQDQATQAVTLQFAPVQAEIDYLKQALSDNQENLTEEDKNRSNMLQVELQDRQDQLDQNKSDMATAQAWAAAAVKNNPGNAAATSAAQRALGLDYTQPGALQQALGLLGQYQTDPTATAQAVANLASTRADIAYKNAQTAALASAGDGSSLAQNNLKTTQDGSQYIDGSSLTGANAVSAQKAAAAAGIPYVSSADAAVLENISSAQTNLAGIQAALANVSPSNALSRLFEIPNYAAEGTTQSGPEANDISSYQGWKASMISAIKGIAGPGSGGARGAALVQQMMDTIPAETDTKAVAAQKIATLNSLLSTSQASILGTQPTAGTTVMTGPDGKQYNVPNAQVAAFTAAGGHK